MTDEPTTLAAVVATGDRRATLEAVRQVLADAIDAGPAARDLAPLVRRLLDVAAELDRLPDADEADELDRLLSTPWRAEE